MDGGYRQEAQSVSIHGRQPEIQSVTSTSSFSDILVFYVIYVTRDALGYVQFAKYYSRCAHARLTLGDD